MGKLSNSPERVQRLFMLEAFIKDNAVLEPCFAYSLVVQYVEPCTKKFVFMAFTFATWSRNKCDQYQTCQGIMPFLCMFKCMLSLLTIVAQV